MDQGRGGKPLSCSNHRQKIKVLNLFPEQKDEGIVVLRKDGFRNDSFLCFLGEDGKTYFKQSGLFGGRFLENLNQVETFCVSAIAVFRINMGLGTFTGSFDLMLYS